MSYAVSYNADEAVRIAHGAHDTYATTLALTLATVAVAEQLKRIADNLAGISPATEIGAALRVVVAGGTIETRNGGVA